MRTLRLENLTAFQRGLYLDALNTSHAMDIDVYLYDQGENLVGQLDTDTYGLIAGQVDVDLTTAVPRQLSADFQQATGGFATDVRTGPFNPGRFLAVDYLVRVSGVDAGADAWVACRCFYGPTMTVTFDHTALTTHIVAQSKESLYLPPNIANDTRDLGGRSKDTKMTLRNLVVRMTKDMGESKFRVAATTVKVTFNRQRYDAFARANGAWVYLQSQARQRGRLLYFDRSGFLKMKRMTHAPVATLTTVTLRDKDGNVILEPNVAEVPQIAFDATTYINAVQVYGKLKGKGKVRLLGAAYDATTAVFSSDGLKRNGHPRLMLQTVQTDDVMTRATAMKRAANILKDAQLSAQSAQLTCLPIPYLDLHDVVALHGDADGIEGAGPHGFIPQAWTLPLTPGDLMTVGYTARIRVITKTRGRLRRVRSRR